MSNIRLFFKESLSLNLVSKLDKSQSHYVSKVMRIKENEVFSLFNSSGEWEAKILDVTKNIVEFEITKQIRQKENQKEDRKDKRVQMEGTQQSELISQRQNDGLPINFEQQEDVNAFM